MLELEISHHFLHSMGVHLGICGMWWVDSSIGECGRT